MKSTRKLLLLAIISNVLISCALDIKPLGYVIRNCTDDTLYMAIAEYNCIDSVKDPLGLPDTIPDSASVVLWNGLNISESEVYPDSISGPFWFIKDISTYYIFVIKRQVATQNTWETIRSKKLYDSFQVTSDSFDDEHILDYNLQNSKK